MKRCYRCGETKPRDQFYNDPGRADGLVSGCRTCVSGAARDRYRARKELADDAVRRIATGGVRLADVRLQLLCKPCHAAKGSLETTHRRLAERGVHLGPIVSDSPANPALLRGDAALILAAVVHA